MVRRNIVLLKTQVAHATILNSNLSEGVRRLIDIDRASTFRVEVDRIGFDYHLPIQAERWKAEQQAAELYPQLQGQGGSIYVFAVVDGHDVLVREYSLAEPISIG
jgi:hypothetical protein